RLGWSERASQLSASWSLAAADPGRGAPARLGRGLRLAHTPRDQHVLSDAGGANAQVQVYPQPGTPTPVSTGIRHPRLTLLESNRGTQARADGSTGDKGLF